MVERCQIKERGCIVVDLDGTLVTGNSLVLLTRYLFNQLIEKNSFREVLYLSYYIFLRKLKLIPHRKMKYKIINISHKFLKKNNIEKFSKILYEKRNISVEKMLVNFQNEGKRILIATAAPDFFLQNFVNLFDNLELDFKGTKFSSKYENFIENKGDEKLKSVEKYLETNNLKCHAIFTDHIDDLPLLIKFPDNNYLIKPDIKTIEAIKKYPQIIYKEIR